MNSMYRGLTEDGKVVFGWLNESHDNFDGIFYHITPRGTALTYKVTFASLAQFTGKHDKNKKPIYGSFEIDGVMTEGGDLVKWDNSIGIVKWDGSKAHFDVEEFYRGSQDCPGCIFSENAVVEIIEGGE